MASAAISGGSLRHRHIRAESTSTFLDIAPEENNMHCFALEPFRKALLALSIREMWPQEFLHQGILANTGWLEEVNTRLRHRENDEHQRTPNVPAIAGMPPTARKSSLHTFITKTCLSGPRVPDRISTGQCCCTDGTLKGHRTNLYGHRRSGISTDEIACAYKTKQSFDATGIHFATKQKMCTWLHCEPDSSVTGIAPYTATEYSFFHLAYGQVGASAEVLEPKEGGFSKRFHIAFANYKSHGDPDQPANDSKAFILRYHDWLASHALKADAPVQDAIAAPVQNGADGIAAPVENVDGNAASAAKPQPYEPPVDARRAFCHPRLISFSNGPSKQCLTSRTIEPTNVRLSTSTGYKSWGMQTLTWPSMLM